MTATLRIADLRAAVSRILDASEREFGPEIELPYGYQWELDPRQIFNVEAGPGEPSLGDLYEDLEEITDLLNRPEDETLVWHDLDHLIGLLQVLVVLDLPGDDEARADQSRT